jgi:ATP-binding cassette subfamily B protein
MVRDVDTILVVRDGKLAERGSHDELMAHDGWYARMYRLQVGEEGAIPSRPARAHSQQTRGP